MAKVGKLLLNLAKKAGYDTTLLAIPTDDFDVPDEFVTALESKLLTEDSAKNNPILKKYFFKQALDGVDMNISRLLDEYQLDDATKAEITGIQSSYDRIPAIVKKIDELQAAKHGATKGDKSLLQEQINRLNQEKATLLDEKKREIEAIKKESDEGITSFMIKTAIQNAKLRTDEFELPVMSEMAETFIKRELSSQGAKVIKKDGTLKLVQASDEALDFYADNKAVSFDDFRDTVLSKYKLIAVNSKPAPSAPGTPPTHPPTTPPANPANSSFARMLAESQADFKPAGN